MNRYQIRYFTSGNYNTRSSIHRGNTEEEAKQKFLRMMKTMGLNKYNIEYFEISEIGKCDIKDA